MISNDVPLLQLDKRKEEIAHIYNLASEGYDLAPLKFFPLSAARLVELIQPQPGQVILDVGTGTGGAAILAAKYCEPGGRIIGVDIAREMLKVATHKAKTVLASNLEFLVGDAQNLNFHDITFDPVLATAALFFLPDMLAGLEEWKRVCKPGGRVAFSGFGLNAFQPLSDIFENLIRRCGVTFPAPRHPFSWQRLTEPDQYLELLHRAGYEDIEIHTQQLGHYLTGVDAWWQVIWNSGFRGPVSRLTPMQFEQFKTEHLAQFAKLTNSQGSCLDLSVIFAIGRKS